MITILVIKIGLAIAITLAIIAVIAVAAGFVLLGALDWYQGRRQRRRTADIEAVMLAVQDTVTDETLERYVTEWGRQNSG